MLRQLLIVIFAALPALAQAPAAPPLGAGFFAQASGTLYPADASGAAGPNHLVSATNAGIVVQRRNGTPLTGQTLAQFWADNTVNGGGYYDPRILYDKAADRFVIAAFYDNGTNVFNANSTLVLGVSDTGDPAGSWTRYRIPVDPSGYSLADYTRIGSTSDRIIITGNDQRGSLIWALPKSELFSGSLKTIGRIVLTGTYNLQPTTSEDNASATEWFLANDTDGHNATVTVYRLDGDQFRYVRIVGVAAPFEVPQNTEIAPQLDGFSMDVGDWSLLSAVARGGYAWTVHQFVLSSPARRSGVRWWRIPLDGTSPAQSGAIDDPTGTTWYAFPSIASNRQGGALIGFTLFRADIHPSIGYAYVSPNGTASAPAIMKLGEGVPHHTRWGDYTTTMADPANDQDFWLIAPYGPVNDLQWAVGWGQVLVPAVPGRVHAVRR